MSDTDDPLLHCFDPYRSELIVPRSPEWLSIGPSIFSTRRLLRVSPTRHRTGVELTYTGTHCHVVYFDTEDERDKSMARIRRQLCVSQ